MIIGIDYHNTISKHPKVFRKLSEAFKASGNSVHIITAVKSNNISKRHEEIKKTKIAHDHLELIVYKDYEEYKNIPQLKLEACKRLGIKILFDDREDVCLLLAEHKILTLQVR